MAKKSKSKDYWILISVLVVLLILFGFLLLLQLTNKLCLWKCSPLVSQVSQPEVTDDLSERPVAYRENSLPKDLPADFPIYPQSKVDSSWSNEEENVLGLSAILKTSDSMEQVNLYYKENLVMAGYKITNEFKNNDSITISFSKDKTSGFIGIAGGETTSISITLGIEK